LTATRRREGWDDDDANDDVNDDGRRRASFVRSIDRSIGWMRIITVVVHVVAKMIDEDEDDDDDEDF
jgi:hypothetical protein